MSAAFAGLLQQGASALRSSSPHTHAGGGAGLLNGGAAGGGSAAAADPPHHFNTATVAFPAGNDNAAAAPPRPVTAPLGFAAAPIMSYAHGAASSGTAAALPGFINIAPAGFPAAPPPHAYHALLHFTFTTVPGLLLPAEAAGPVTAAGPEAGAAGPVTAAGTEAGAAGPVTAAGPEAGAAEAPVVVASAAEAPVPLVVASAAPAVRTSSNSFLMVNNSSGDFSPPGLVDEEERRFWEDLVQEYDGKAIGGTVPSAAVDPGATATALPQQLLVEPQQRRSSVRGLMQAPPVGPQLPLVLEEGSSSGPGEDAYRS